MIIYRITVLLFLFLAGCVLAGCAHLDPSMRELAPPPITLEGKLKPVQPEDAERGLFEEQDTDAEAELAKMLEDLESGARVFNQRLDAMLGQTQPRVIPEVSSVTPLSGDQQEISFNFYDADLVEVIRLFMHLLGGNYSVHPGISGRVSLSVEDTFNRDQLLELLQGVLRIHGAALIRDELLWEILPLTEVPAHIGSDRLILSEEGGVPVRGQIIRGFRLHFISAEEMTNVIKPYLSKGAQVYADERLGILLVSDYPHALKKVADLIVMFDVSVFADIKARVYPLRHVAVAEAALEMETVAKGFGLGLDKGSPRSRVSFLPVERTNMLLVLTRDGEILEFLDIWVRELDREIPEVVQEQYRENVFVYYVQYGEAAEMVATLAALFGGQTASTRTAQQQDRTEPRGSGLFGQTGDGQNESGATPGQSTRPAGAMTAGQDENAVMFVVDEQNNAIVTRSSSANYAQILTVIEKLDLYPKQVLIEVVIAEVNLNEGARLGIEWRALLNPRLDMVQTLSVDSGLGEITNTTSAITSGLSYVITATDRLQAALKASAERGNARILSTPTLLASDNKPAHINIGSEVPIPTSTRVRSTETSETETTETTIQYRNTGIILEVTPKINKQGMVRMDISQEVSAVTDRTVQGVNAPVISNRKTSTTVSVNDQQTIVIGGLIQQTQNDLSRGVPGLIRVPLLKYLFGYEQKQFENTELMIFITPHVVLSEPDTVFITKDFQRRLDEIKAAMYD